jgi:hypothetical protein
VSRNERCRRRRRRLDDPSVSGCVGVDNARRETTAVTFRPSGILDGCCSGYARASTADQPATSSTRCGACVAKENIFVDHASGAKASRPRLDEVLLLLRDGDTLKITAGRPTDHVYRPG